MKGVLLLLIGSFIWGTTFVAQSVGTNHLDAFSFNCIRNFIGVLALAPVLLWQICTTPQDMNPVQNTAICENEQNGNSTITQRLKSIFTRDLAFGGLSCGIAYTFQIIGQKHLAPTVASLLMSLESVFATLAGWVVLKEILSTKELIGCGLVFAAVILTQIPAPKISKNK